MLWYPEGGVNCCNWVWNVVICRGHTDAGNGPYSAKLTPTAILLQGRGLGSWMQQGQIQEAMLALNVVTDMVVPCCIIYERELSSACG